MIFPNFPHGPQESVTLLALMHRVLTATSWERRGNLFFGEHIQILSDELIDAIVNDIAMLGEDKVVRVTVGLFV